MISEIMHKNILNRDLKEKIDLLVYKVMREKHVPGISVTLVSQKHTNYLSYGYGDEKYKFINPSTCFELGSISKSYTGLAILILEYRNKLSLEDSISKYIPWLQLYDNKRKIELSNQIKIKHLLHHTSGIPNTSISLIYSSGSQKKLEDILRKLNGTVCIFHPGEKMHYATINYDILGHIIEIVTGRSYDIFISENILNRLELDNTFLSRATAKNKNSLSVGFKYGYGHSIRYNAPEYKGNLPAGYIISNAIDMGKWMSVQMGQTILNKELKDCIMRSQIVDSTVEFIGRYGYGSGWYIHCHGKIVKHGGSNPNYSNMLILDKDREIGICVLTNINSSAANIIAENILRLMYTKDIKPFNKNYNEKLDYIFSYISISLIISVVYLVHLIKIEVIHIAYTSHSLLTSCFAAIGALALLYLSHKIIKKVKKIFSIKMLLIWLPYSVLVGYGMSIILFIIIWGIMICFFSI